MPTKEEKKKICACGKDNCADKETKNELPDACCGGNEDLGCACGC